MAQLKYVSTDSIKVAKSRLRKQLNIIEANKSLYNYFERKQEEE